MTLCIAAVAICFIGCGSDSSNESTPSNAVNSAPPQKNSSAVKTGLLNVDDFIKQYNAALDALGNRFDKMKIVGKRNDLRSCFELKLYSQNIRTDNNFSLPENYNFYLLDTNFENINLSNFDNREIFILGYGSMQPTDPANKAAYIAVLKTFPQFRDLNYDALLNQISTVGADNFEKTRYENALLLKNAKPDAPQVTNLKPPMIGR